MRSRGESFPFSATSSSGAIPMASGPDAFQAVSIHQHTAYRGQSLHSEMVHRSARCEDLRQWTYVTVHNLSSFPQFMFSLPEPGSRYIVTYLAGMADVHVYTVSLAEQGQKL